MTKFIASKFQVGQSIASINSLDTKSAEYWDADMQSYMYLQDFVNTTSSWEERLRNVALQARDKYGKGLDHEIEEMLELAPEREERFMEIIDQDDADGAANYWLGMLQISPARNPATYLMMRVGRRIGEHVVMCLKGYFRAARPSQLCPAILPMIDPPATPSFPAGHAVQAYLMSYLLAYSLPNIPQHTTPKKLDAAEGSLFDLGYRVSQNRVVAGLHFPIDITAGRAVGIACFDALQDVDSIWGDRENETGELRRKPEASHLTQDTSLEAKSLRARVREEFPQYK
jgi:acid phosphatase (class A)